VAVEMTRCLRGGLCGRLRRHALLNSPRPPARTQALRRFGVTVA